MTLARRLVGTREVYTQNSVAGHAHEIVLEYRRLACSIFSLNGASLNGESSRRVLVPTRNRRMTCHESTEHQHENNPDSRRIQDNISHQQPTNVYFISRKSEEERKRFCKSRERVTEMHKPYYVWSEIIYLQYRNTDKPAFGNAASYKRTNHVRWAVTLNWGEYTYEGYNTRKAK